MKTSSSPNRNQSLRRSIRLDPNRIRRKSILERCRSRCYHIERSCRTRGQRKLAYAEAYAKRDEELEMLNGNV